MPYKLMPKEKPYLHYIKDYDFEPKFNPNFEFQWDDELHRTEGSGLSKYASLTDFVKAHNCSFQKLVTVAKDYYRGKEELQKTCGRGWVVFWDSKRRKWRKQFYPGRSRKHTPWWKWPKIWICDLLY